MIRPCATRGKTIRNVTAGRKINAGITASGAAIRNARSRFLLFSAIVRPPGSCCSAKTLKTGGSRLPIEGINLGTADVTSDQQRIVRPQTAPFRKHSPEAVNILQTRQSLNLVICDTHADESGVFGKHGVEINVLSIV